MTESIVLKYFKEISEIPRASFNEEAVSNYVVDFAKARGLRYIQDEMKNVIVFKDASKGYEDLPVVMLQSHLDMVAEKNKDSDHNFETDPIKLIEKDGILYADNTTLKEAALELGLVTAEEFDKWVVPGNMIGEL